MEQCAPRDQWGERTELSRGLLAEMAGAGRQFLEVRHALTSLGRTIVEELAGDRIEPYIHYPRGDVYDADSGAQYYFHTHRPAEYGHIHTFLRRRPAGASDYRGERPDRERPFHLVAIGLDCRGEPADLFTTNRWVTAEGWQPAAVVAGMLSCFRIDCDQPSPAANMWVTSLVTLFRPQIIRLLADRDAYLEQRGSRLPAGLIYEDREVEVTSRMPIDVDRQIAEVRLRLEGARLA